MKITDAPSWNKGLWQLHTIIRSFLRREIDDTELILEECSLQSILQELHGLQGPPRIDFIGPQLFFNFRFDYGGVPFNLSGNVYYGSFKIIVLSE